MRHPQSAPNYQQRQIRQQQQSQYQYPQYQQYHPHHYPMPESSNNMARSNNFQEQPYETPFQSRLRLERKAKKKNRSKTDCTATLLIAFIALSAMIVLMVILAKYAPNLGMGS